MLLDGLGEANLTPCVTTQKFKINFVQMSRGDGKWSYNSVGLAKKLTHLQPSGAEIDFDDLPERADTLDLCPKK
jgi:hypothetical protein